MRSIQTHLCLLCACFILHRAQVSDSLNPNTSLSPGSPLNEAEYTAFWELFKPDWKAKYICQIRESFGCEEQRVHRFDLFENHGSLPNGTVCSESKNLSPFASFCKFALYRCSSQQFYLKRIPCGVHSEDVSREFRSLITKAPVHPVTTIPHPSKAMHKNAARSTKSSPKLTTSGLKDKKKEARLTSFLHTQIVNLFHLSLRVNDLEPTQESSDKKAQSRGRRSGSFPWNDWPGTPQRLRYEEQQRKILEANYGISDRKNKTKA